MTDKKQGKQMQDITPEQREEYSLRVFGLINGLVAQFAERITLIEDEVGLEHTIGANGCDCPRHNAEALSGVLMRSLGQKVAITEGAAEEIFDLIDAKGGEDEPNSTIKHMTNGELKAVAKFFGMGTELNQVRVESKEEHATVH